VDHRDVIQAGYLGLLDAIKKYKPEKGSFKNYAAFRIRGAIFDYLRKQDWLSKPARQAVTSLSRVRKDTEQRLGRHATDDEVADAAGITLDEFYQIERELLGLHFIAFDESRDTTFANGSNWPQDIREALADAVAELPVRERAIVRMLYETAMSMEDAGEALGICRSRVCQIHAKTLLKLKWQLRRFAPDMPHTEVLSRRRHFK
jgi:RNA polymerase sigma factor for flagellar operon FliA